MPASRRRRRSSAGGFSTWSERDAVAAQPVDAFPLGSHLVDQSWINDRVPLADVSFTGARFDATLPPHSITLFVLPGGAAAPSAPANLRVIRD